MYVRRFENVAGATKNITGKNDNFALVVLQVPGAFFQPPR